MPFRKLMLAGVVSVIMFAVTGCGLVGMGKGDNTGLPTDNTTVATNGDIGDGNENASTGSVRNATLYFVDANGYVVPMLEKIPVDTGIAKETLTYMVAGGPGDALLKRTGLQGVLPAGTKILGVDIDKTTGIAKVDFSKEVLNYKTAKQGQDIVDATVWALTEFPDIKKVQIEVNGEIKPVMPISLTPVGEPVSRDAGINLQVQGDVNPSDASRLTLYFQGSNTDGSFHYLVPVTREIPKTASENIIRETMVQLASGPMATGLAPTVSPGTQVADSSIEGNTATVDFAQAFTEGSNLQRIALDAIVLSIAENTHVDKVKMTIQGKAPVLSQNDGMDLSKPVSKPMFVNQSQL